MADPYQTLGVKPTASETEIRAAYRRLAKQHHPDLNPGNKRAEERFKEVSAAYDLLSDATKRARYDRGEIDASGQERAERPFHRGSGGGRGGTRYRPQHAAGAAGPGEADLDEILSAFFHGGQRHAANQMPGEDVRTTMTVDFIDAVNGAKRSLSLSGGRSLEVSIPVGIEDGQVMRLKGQGAPSEGGGPAGDVLIEIRIAPHAIFRREQDDIHIEVPVTLAEAVLGGRITVPTPSGSVTLTVPPHSDSGTRLRLRGKGVPAHRGRPAGNAFANLKVVVGQTDAEFETFLRDWSQRHPRNPRGPMSGKS